MRPLLLLLPMMALACSGSDEGTDDSGTEVVYTGCLADGISVEPGTGVDSYISLSDGDDVTMVHGPQGGWHIDVGGTVSHTEQLVSIDATFVDTATGIQVAGSQTEVRQALVGWDDVGCSGDFYGVRVFVDDLADNVGQDDICALAGATLDMTLTVTAIEAEPPAVTSVTLPVVAALDPADVPICAGAR